MYTSPSLYALALGSTLAVAAPTWPTTGSNGPSQRCNEPSRTMTVNFEDLQSLAGVELSPIPTPFHGLNYEAWTGVDIPDSPLPHVKPHSGTKNIAAGLPSKLLAGTARISTNYPDSDVKSFDMHSFWYACGINLGQSLVNVPTSCIVDVTGFRGDENTGSNEEVCHTRLRYDPGGLLGGNGEPAFGRLSEECKGLSYAEVVYSKDELPLGEDLIGVAIDDFTYTLNYCDEFEQDGEPGHEEPWHQKPEHESHEHAD